MYKLVSPRELTEIITGLLLKPELLGELDSPEKHRMFMADLGRVVAEHCGGLVNSVVLPGTEVTVSDGYRLMASRYVISESKRTSLTSL